MFHFNKMHNQDPLKIPPWIVKHKGQSYYCWHITIAPGLGFSTKETPDNEHTKAAIKLKGRLRIENEEAEIY